MEGGTREERLQMRQRGAGTRKIKEVNFGFSLGSGLGLPEPTISANPPKPKESVQSETAPSAITPKASQVGSQLAPESRRTPGSARNQLPARPSPYDVPFDEGPNHPRSNKRRKISPPNKAADKSSRHRVSLSTNETSASTQSVAPIESNVAAPQEFETFKSTTNIRNSNPSEHTTDTLATAESPSVEEVSKNAETEPSPAVERDNKRTGNPQGPGNAPIETPSNPDPDRAGLPQSELNVSQAVVEHTQQINRKQHQAQSTSPVEQPPEGSKAIKRKGRPPKSTLQISEQSDKLADVSLTRYGANEISLEADAEPLPTDNQPKDAPINSKDKEYQAPNSSSTFNSKQRRGRKGQGSPDAHEKPQSVGKAAPDVTESDPKNTQVESQPDRKRPRGRPSLGGRKDNASEKNTQSQSPGEEAIVSAEQKRPRGRPSLGGKKNNISDKKSRPQSPTGDAIVTAEQSTATSRRGRKPTKASAPASTESEQPPEPEQEPTPEPEPETLTAALIPRPGKLGKKNRKPEGPEHSNEEGLAASEPKTQRGRPSKKTKRPDKPGSPDTESEPATKATKMANQETNKKPREPRGETVPVTVHRLANVSALGSMYTSRDSGDEEESTDELSTHHKTKLPNRGGVNPADVLSQICRETLEKTLTTLKEGIANETNTTRKAEWSRKRKAVEAFGSELDGSLLDLSEMLDSNFVLGMQLKKAKRDMMDMRSHLYRIRRERENIALQMDSVRSRHMEEENATTARSTINNSLHSLDLALDRSQNRTSSLSDPSFADLEFMLRTVADDVSSQGTHGGLLNQIRGFNAQLEAAARHLEK